MLDFLRRLFGQDISLTARAGRPAYQPVDRPDATKRLVLWAKGGFHTEDAAFESLREEYLEPHTISSDDARWIGEEAARIYADKREEETTWPPVTEFDRLSRAFDELEATGILALHCPGNTRSEGVSEAYELHRQRQDAGEQPRGFVFYHAQDVDKAVEGQGIYLAFGSFREEAGAPLGVARETVATVERNGLQPRWNGGCSYADPRTSRLAETLSDRCVIVATGGRGV